jgi:hypothetical protein
MFSMGFIRRCPVAASYVPAARRSVTSGELAKSKLAKAAAVERLPFSTSLLSAENFVSKDADVFRRVAPQRLRKPINS